MSTACATVHVCQRCCNPLKLHPDLENLSLVKISALVDAQQPDKEDSRPPIIVPVKNVDSDYPRYRVPPRKNEETLAAFQRSSVPTTGMDHRQQVSANLFDLLSGRTDVDHPLCQECADILIAAKQQCLAFQEDELNCLRMYMSYLDTKAAKAEAKLKRCPPQTTQGSTGVPYGRSTTDTTDSKSGSSIVDDDSSVASNWMSCVSATDRARVLTTSVLESRNEEDENGEDDSWNDDSDLEEEMDSPSRPGASEDSLAEAVSASCTTDATQDHYMSLQSVAPVAEKPFSQPRLTGLSALKNRVDDLQEKLKHVLGESARLEQLLSTDTAELERRTEELDKAQTQYNEQKQALLESEQEMFSLEARVKHSERHLKRLLRTNVLNTAFPIWYDEHFCVINGLHLGRLPNQPIPWEEINAAWGQCAMLLQCMARKLNYTFTDYRVVPIGSQSKVLDQANHKEYPLYYPTSSMQLFGVSKFDNAMCIFLKCLQQIQQVVEDWTQTKLPYCIKESGKIHDHNEGKTYSIKYSGNSDENWTKALKMMLINMKWIIARLAGIDGQRANPPTNQQAHGASTSGKAL